MSKRCLEHVMRMASASGFLLVLATGVVEAEEAKPGPDGTVSPPKPDLTCRVSAYLDGLRGTAVTEGQVVQFTGTRKVFYVIHIKNSGAGKAPASQASDTPYVSYPDRVESIGVYRDVPALSPGEEVALPFREVAVTAGGAVYLTGATDGQMKVAESNETNNACTLSFTTKVAMRRPSGSASRSKAD
jgi:subtilase family serine protease